MPTIKSALAANVAAAMPTNTPNAILPVKYLTLIKATTTMNAARYPIRLFTQALTVSLKSRLLLFTPIALYIPYSLLFLTLPDFSMKK